jgi:glycosyltransferase involved in cell wall biosynthesis
MRPLRIALTADPYIPVPPTLYGGIERMLDILVRGLTAHGHEVTLLAHPASAPAAPVELVGYGAPPHWGMRARTHELWQAASALWRRRGALDLVHSFGRLAALVPLLPLRGLPKVQSYQRATIPWRSVRTAVRLAGDSIRFVGCSASVFADRPDDDGGGRWLRIFNAVELSRYPFRPSVAPDAPLAFLGRLERIKGVHHAIAIARAAGRRLVIAGNRVDGDDGYFEREVAPHLDDERVRYAGPLDDAGKAKLLGAAAALLMPVEWEEPFGIVMAEALACGTPVVGFRRGGVAEVVRDGTNGFLCRTVAEAAAAVGRLASLDRAAVRADCEARFGDRVFLEQHESLYAELVAAAGARR